MKIFLTSLFALSLFAAPTSAINLSQEQPSISVVDAECQTLDAEFAEAARYQWSVFKTISGAEAEEFMKRYNAIPPASNEKAVTIHLLKRAGVAQTGVVFADEKNCVKKRFFVGKATLDLLLGVNA